MDYLFCGLLFIIGACLGSFAVASAWRLRFRQLLIDKRDGYKLTAGEKKELASLQKVGKKSISKDRSACLHCGRELAPLDLIPVISWLWLRGKCRTCNKPIGIIEFAAEIGLGFVLVASYMVWPFGFHTTGAIILAFLWVVLLVLLTIHLVYDARWLLLLDIITIAVAIIAVLYVTIRFVTGYAMFDSLTLMNLLGSLVFLPGFYGVLYAVSKGNWIGYGDVKLLVPLAIILPTWQHAFLVLFLANLIGCLWIIPGALSKKIGRSTRIPFGPFLIIAWLITMMWGSAIISFYLNNILFSS